MQPATIKIFLTDGELTGIRTAEFTAPSHLASVLIPCLNYSKPLVYTLQGPPKNSGLKIHWPSHCMYSSIPVIMPPTRILIPEQSKWITPPMTLSR